MAQAVILIVLSGFLYRARGSSWTDIDSELKGLRIAKLIVGASPLALAAFHIGLAWYWCLGILALTALADTIPHAKNQGAVDVKQAVTLVPNAIASAIPVTVGLYANGHYMEAYYASVFVILIAPAYFIGNRLPIYFMVGPIGFRKGPEIGEALYGLTRCLFLLFGGSL